MMQGDVWAISPSTSATLLRAAAAIGGAGPVVLLNNGTVAPNGCGYQVLITSAGNDSGITFTVTGIRVGELNGATTTEVLTGPNIGTVATAGFYTVVTSVVASGASAGNVSIGTTGSLALPRTRLKSIYYVGAASAGAIEIRVGTASGALVARYATPATSQASAFNIQAASGGGNGVLVTRNQFGTDYGNAVVVLSQVTEVTLMCG